MDQNCNSSELVASLDFGGKRYASAASALCAIITLLGLANVSVFICAAKDKELRRKPFSWLLAAMAVADLSATQVGAPILMALFLNFELGLPSGVCVVYIWVGITSVTFTLASITGMALIRVRACYSNNVYQVHPVAIGLLIIVGYSSGMAVSALYTLDSGNPSPSLLACSSTQTYLQTIDDDSDYFNDIYMVQRGMVVCCIGTVIVCYAAIFFKFCCKRNLLVATAESHGLQMATLASLITGLFMLCFLPVTILPAVLSYNQSKTARLLTLLSSNIIMFLQSALNPYMYIWKSKYYRRVLASFLPTKCAAWLRRNRIVPMTMNVLPPAVRVEERQ